MKSLHFPFHTHRSAGGGGPSKFHHLTHDERFWAIVTFVLFLMLFVAMGILAMTFGVGGDYNVPYFH